MNYLTPDINIAAEQKNECQRCKTLVESYNHWFSKTAHGKHEGGDAAWEETKLKSYTSSELRLVDIQEGLCSELKKHQDHCYTLAEEAEQALEHWWFKEDVNSKDFYTWLCIETMKYCCPKSHYGESCQPCLVNTNNDICSGHGKCHGEETRKGDGSCVCTKGYTGNMCDTCAKNYYLSENVCLPCHKSCEGCTNRGAGSCIQCKNGWEMQTEGCRDIDECQIDTVCESNQFCLNSEGSYVCKPCDKSCKACVGTGLNNCTACNNNDILWDRMCISQEQKEEMVSRSILRAIVYLGLLLSCFLIYKTSKNISFVFIVLVSVYIYYYEKISPLKTFDTIIVYWRYLRDQ